MNQGDLPFIYLDHNATTPVRPEVEEAMLPYQGRICGNASSLHTLGRQSRQAIEEARDRVASAIGAGSEDIIFTGCGSESDNLAVKGVAWKNRSRGTHIITSRVEHPAVIETCRYLEKNGFRVTYVPVDEAGLVSPDAVAEAITPETVLISVMLANNEVGTIQPVGEIAAAARARGVPVHTDAVQALGKIPLDVEQLGADLVTLSAHKIYGPKGVGALWRRRGVKLEPLIHGGEHEKGLRAGTENTAGIVGFGRAAELAAAELEQYAVRVGQTRDQLEQEIMAAIDQVRFNGHREKRLPNTLNLSFEFVEGEGILLGLDSAGIAVSTGSACSSGSLEPSHVMLAMGLSPVDAQGAIRFSLGRDNRLEQIPSIVSALKETVERLRSISPFYRQPEEGGEKD